MRINEEFIDQFSSDEIKTQSQETTESGTFRYAIAIRIQREKWTPSNTYIVIRTLESCPFVNNIRVL